MEVSHVCRKPGLQSRRLLSQERTRPDEESLSDEATFAGAAKRRLASEVSIGDERTLGDNISGQDTVIDDIEVVDLESRYRVEGTLGQGGMGAVLLATDTRLDRKVAIKRILGETAGNRMALQRFLTEAKSIAALNHQNIVQIYDYGRAKDGPFLIMEYVAGGSLLDKCRDGALPLEEAVAMACQLCDGLAKAHDLGIIHRDIKPANVLLTKDGTPKLTDFGLAKVQASDHGQTMTGALLGTPDFMPPEQRRDASLVDNRSDLWSLAATVYQMVTGRSPKIVRLHELPHPLQAVISRALEDTKDARYQSARELRDAIRDAFSLSANQETSHSSQVGKADLESGECPKCHARNESQRKFCRECAKSLRWACLSCEHQIPVWDKVCPECGKKQPELLAAWCETLDRQRVEAEAALAALHYEEAIASAQAAEVPDDDRFTEHRTWRERVIAEARADHQIAITDRIAKIKKAERHRSAFDYSAAIYALESIPEQLRFADGSQLLSTLRAEKEEAASLLATLRGRIDSKQLDGMVPLVQRAIQLRGDRKDLPTLLDRLIEREELLASRERKQRDWILETFQKAIDEFRMHGEAKAAVDILLPFRRLLTSEQAKQLDMLLEAVAAEQRLGELLALAKADGKVRPSEAVELAQAVVKCISLAPNCQRLLAFRDQLLKLIVKTPDQFVEHKASLRGLFATLSQSSLQSVPSELRPAPTREPHEVDESVRSKEQSKAKSRPKGTGPVAENGAEEPMVEGQCANCRTTHTDFSRKFCRKCSFSLRKTCKNCQESMPVWDAICGDCGHNQNQSPFEHVVSLARGRKRSDLVRCPACGADCRADRLVQHFERVHRNR